MTRMSAAAVLQDYANGKRDFSGVRLSYGEVFKDVDLTGIKFTGADLNCRFEDVNLTSADFSGTGLSAIFINVNLTGSNFANTQHSKCKFQNVKFLRANLRSSSIQSSSITNCDFSMADLSQARLYIVRVEDSDFSQANFSKSWTYDFRIETSCLREASFHNAVISYIDYAGTTYEKVDFTGSLVNIEGFPIDCLFDKSIITQNVTRVKPGTDMRGIKLSKKNLSYFNFRGCDLRDAEFVNCDLLEADFNNCDLRGVSFLGSRNFDDYWTEGSMFSKTTMPNGSLRDD